MSFFCSGGCSVYTLTLTLNIFALPTVLSPEVGKGVKLYRMEMVVVCGCSPVPKESFPSLCVLFGEQAANSAAPSLFAMLGQFEQKALCAFMFWSN